MTWTFEADQADNLINGYTSLALYDELAWEIIQGIQLIGKYDFFDPKTNWLDGAISRYTLGAEIFNIFDVQNSITNTFVRDVYTKVQYAIPNYLTPRVFNVRVTAKF